MSLSVDEEFVLLLPVKKIKDTAVRSGLPPFIIINGTALVVPDIDRVLLLQAERMRELSNVQREIAKINV